MRSLEMRLQTLKNIQKSKIKSVDNILFYHPHTIFCMCIPSYIFIKNINKIMYRTLYT